MASITKAVLQTLVNLPSRETWTLPYQCRSQHIHHQGRPERLYSKHLCWWHQDIGSELEEESFKGSNPNLQRRLRWWTWARLASRTKIWARSREADDKALSTGIYSKGSDKILPWQSSPHQHSNERSQARSKPQYGSNPGWKKKEIAGNDRFPNVLYGRNQAWHGIFHRCCCLLC